MGSSSANSTSSQWQRLLKNTGTWQGSFTQVSAQGQILSDVRTEVELAPSDNGLTMHQEVRRYPTDGPAQIQKLDYRSLNRATLFFENGAFSQGSMQWGPFSSFGAELGLISGDRRLRLVQLFEKNELKSISLIRERLEGTQSEARSPLKLSDLLGTWQGQTVTQYADLRPERYGTSQLTVEQIGPHQIRQTICQTISPGSDRPPISSTGELEGSRLLFRDGAQPVQVLLLPDGASSTCPIQIIPRQPIFLEAGWLLNSRARQRLIRQYDSTGAWVSLTLVTEQKV